MKMLYIAKSGEIFLTGKLNPQSETVAKWMMAIAVCGRCFGRRGRRGRKLLSVKGLVACDFLVSHCHSG